MSKSSRYFVRLTLAFINRFKLIFFVGILLGIFSFIFLTILIPRLPRQTEKIGIIGEYSTNNLPDSIVKMIGSGLTTLDKLGQAQPAIAESWAASDSGKIWTFNVGKNLHWQDKTSVTTADINYNFSDVSVANPDKYTIVFKLKTPLADFPVILAKPIFKQGLLGVGEWRVTGLTLAGNFIETLTLMDSNNDRKIFKFYPTEARAKLAFELGQVEKVVDLATAKPFDTWNTAKVTGNMDQQRYVAVFFNTADNVVGDKDMRQALSYGINKSMWKDNRALGPISPNSWAYNPSVKPYDHDIDRAKELIDAAKIDPAARKSLKVTLTTSPNLLDVANKIAKDWKEIGVDTSIQVTSFVPDSYQAFLATYDIPTDPDQYNTWHSTQNATNITKYKNTRIDKLLEDGRLEVDQTKRKGVYFDFQKFLLEDAPAAFLYYPTYYSVTKK